MALPNGRALPLLTAFPAPRLLSNQTEPCVALPITHYILKNGAPSGMARLSILYAARIGYCCSCPLRAQCQESSSTLKPRRVSAVLWPLSSSHFDSSPSPDTARVLLPSAPVLWKDWPRCGIRRAWLKVVRSQTICVESSSQLSSSFTQAPPENLLTRTERAHWRLSWERRLARNARPADAPRLVVTLHGLPATFASAFGFDLLATA